jgi:hypothetical protein
MGRDRDGIRTGRDGTGRDGTGRDGTGWDWSGLDGLGLEIFVPPSETGPEAERLVLDILAQARGLLVLLQTSINSGCGAKPGKQRKAVIKAFIVDGRGGKDPRQEGAVSAGRGRRGATPSPHPQAAPPGRVEDERSKRPRREGTVSREAVEGERSKKPRREGPGRDVVEGGNDPRGAALKAAITLGGKGPRRMCCCVVVLSRCCAVVLLCRCVVVLVCCCVVMFVLLLCRCVVVLLCCCVVVLLFVVVVLLCCCAVVLLRCVVVLLCCCVVVLLCCCVAVLV